MHLLFDFGVADDMCQDNKTEVTLTKERELDIQIGLSINGKNSKMLVLAVSRTCG